MEMIFSPIGSMLTVSLVLLVSLILLLIREFFRPIKGSLRWRLVANITMFIALFLLMLNPKIPVKKVTNKTIILTDNFNQKSIDSLLNLSDFEVLFYDSLTGKQKKELTDKNVIVVGDGVPVYDLDLLNPENTSYVSGTMVKGITQVKFENELIVGNQFEVSGKINVEDSVVVKLSVGNTILDSVKLASGWNEFNLSNHLNTEGKFLYELEYSTNNLLQKELLPVWVKPRQILNILILNAFPTFETRYLKQYLADMGHQVIVRNKITTGKYKFETYNRDPVRFNTIKRELIEQADILIIDNESINQLRSSEISNIQSAVENNGLGLLIQADEQVKNRDFKFVKIDGDKKVKIGEDEFTFQTIGLALSGDINPLWTTIDGEVLTGYVNVGLGKMGVIVIANTFGMLLEGNQNQYGEFWKQTLDGISQNIVGGNEWDVNGISIIDLPTNIDLKSFEEIPVAFIDDTHLPMRQHTFIPQRWESTFWPVQKGWFKLRTEESPEQISWLYVYDDSAWLSVRKYEQYIINRNLLKGDLKDEPRYIEGYEKINPIWFYLLFLVSVGYLWVEPKL